ncbi:MAG: carbohydrate ABC transporter permease [Candidatus Riflebacteria bacterium]|nr:carbohydrate ABC transporter permease [Candidatus Riflebacteria bacterium]
MKKINTNLILTILFSIICIFHMYPVMMILFNSLKKESAISTSTVFELPTAETFNGLSNYVNAIDAQGFLWSLFYSVIITVSSVALILVCCSMCAWYISRVNSWLSKLIYAMCAFSMVAPFQLVMFTLSQTADRFHVGMLRFNSPYTICVIYLGFGAGLAVFMFSAFMKSIPVEMEEAAMIDGCNPFQTFFKIVFPVLKPSMISIGVLETMWIWNDYLLPTLVLDIKQYKTIPMLIQYFRGSYGSVQMGPMMACVVLTIVPVIIIYLIGQKHIIKSIVSGAVKG